MLTSYLEKHLDLDLPALGMIQSAATRKALRQEREAGEDHAAAVILGGVEGKRERDEVARERERQSEASAIVIQSSLRGRLSREDTSALHEAEALSVAAYIPNMISEMDAMYPELMELGEQLCSLLAWKAPENDGLSKDRPLFSHLISPVTLIIICE